MISPVFADKLISLNQSHSTSQQPQIYLHSDETNNASREFSYHPLRLAQSIRIITLFDWSKESKEIFYFHFVIRERIEPSVTMAKVDFLEF